MRRAQLELLRCPACGGPLGLDGDSGDLDPIPDGSLICTGCSASYPVRESIPRFVPPETYAESFGFQWNRFRRTQLDSFTGQSISRDRFLEQSGWSPDELAGKRVLDVGCGAGRFAEIALNCGAEVTAVDYSTAVEACWANLGPGSEGRLTVLQGDVNALPFEPATFDYVYCFGVLQHTPDPRAAFFALTEQLAPGGRLAVDVYPRIWFHALWPKFWLRPFTKRIEPERLFGWVERWVPILLPLSVTLGRVPLVGRSLRFVVPVISYDGVFPLTKSQLRQWAILDTFDMLAPAYDSPQSDRALRSWLEESGLVHIEVFRRNVFVGRGRAPQADASRLHS